MLIEKSSARNWMRAFDPYTRIDNVNPTTPRTRLAGVIAAIASLSLLGAACGSDEETSDRTEAPEDDENEDENDDENDDDAGAESDDEADDDDDGDDDEGDEDEGDDDGFEGDVPDLTEQCEALEARFDEEFGDDFNLENFDEMVEAMDDVKDLTPDELDSDIDLVIGQMEEMGAILAEADGDILKVMEDPELLARMEALDSPEVQAANDRVEAYFDEACPGVGD